MRVLVIGGGGREHALVWKISQSPKVTDIYCAPGNAGTAEIAYNVPIAADQIDQLLEFAQKKRDWAHCGGTRTTTCDGNRRPV